jgi:hypothetical protein
LTRSSLVVKNAWNRHTAKQPEPDRPPTPGRYHNDRYRALGVEVGLEVGQHHQFGWTLHDGLSELTAARYRTDLNRLSAALVAHRRTLTRAASDGRKDSNNGITAECTCPRKIRTSRASWAAGPIVCAICRQPFRSDTEPDPDE